MGGRRQYAEAAAGGRSGRRWQPALHGRGCLVRTDGGECSGRGTAEDRPEGTPALLLLPCVAVGRAVQMAAHWTHPTRHTPPLTPHPIQVHLSETLGSDLHTLAGESVDRIKDLDSQSSFHTTAVRPLRHIATVRHRALHPEPCATAPPSPNRPTMALARCCWRVAASDSLNLSHRHEHPPPPARRGQ